MKLFSWYILFSFILFAKPEMSPNDFVGTYDTESKDYMEFNPDINQTGEKEFLQVSNENNRTNYYLLEMQRVDENVSHAGKVSFEFNASNMEELDGFLENNKDRFIKISRQITSKVTDSSVGEVHMVSSDYIYEHSDQNSTRRKVITSIAEVERNLFAKLSNKKTFTCYISRTLKAGYMCPIPGLESAINGYAQKDRKEDGLKNCNKRCKKKKSCISKKIENNMVINKTLNQNLFTKKDFLFNLNHRLITKSIDFQIKVSDLNDTKLENRRYKIRYALEYKYLEEDQEWKPFFENKIHDLKSSDFKLTIILNKPISKVRVKFYTIYEIDPLILGREILLDSKYHKFILLSQTINYLGNKHWFCPVTQFIYPGDNEAVKCRKGVVKYLSGAGASVQQVCVPNELSFDRDKEFGGYKSEAMCNSICYESEECITTYRQPGAASLNGYIPDDKFDLEVGCVDTPINTACTKKKCEDIIDKDIRPLEEKMWDNNDNVIITIKNGVRENGVARPKIDLSSEYGTNSDTEAKQDVFKDEMKDIAYANMINNNTYNVSAQKINSNYSTQMAYEHNVDDATEQVSLTWLIKPESKDYDNGKRYNFYSIMAIDIIYHPVKAISNNQGTEYLSLDPKSRAIDRLFLLHTSGGWKIFRRIEYLRLFSKVNKPNQPVKYDWHNSYRPINDNLVHFVNGEFRLYSSSEKPTPFLSKKIVSNAPFERTTVVDDLHATLSTINGLYFHSQEQRSGREVVKNYTSDLVKTEAAAYYGLSAYGMYVLKNKALSYKNIVDKLDKSQYFDLYKKTTYPSTIQSNTIYSDEHIKFYVHGTQDNISVHATINPDSTEEGKRAFFYMFLYEK